MADQLTEPQAIIQAAAALLVDTALKVIESDPHQWSARPCSTCRVVTAMVGRRFGCEAYIQRVKAP